MNDTDGLTHQMLVRSREAFAQNINDFSAGGAARQLFADLQTVIIEVEQKAAAHGAGRSDAKQGTQTLNEAREDLLADLFAIREAAKVMGVEDKFPYPPRNNDEQLLQMAGVYATNALPLKAELIAHELPADFLEDRLTPVYRFDYSLYPKSPRGQRRDEERKHCIHAGAARD